MNAKRLCYIQSDRYLTLPNSRIVINPYEFEALEVSVSQAQYQDRADLPLHLGYCDPAAFSHAGDTWQNAMMVYERAAVIHSGSDVVWNADFSSAQNWTERSGIPSVTCSDHSLTVFLSAAEDLPPIRVIESVPVRCNLNRAILSFYLDFLQPGTRFAIKISKDNWKSNICLMYTRRSGFFEFPLWLYTGWAGDQTISLQIHVLEGCGDVATISQMKITEVAYNVLPAIRHSFCWEPACLSYQAEYSSGSNAEITDYFANETALIRKISFSAQNDLIVAGRFSGTYQYENRKIKFLTDKWSAAIAVSDPDITFEFYDCFADFLGQTAMSNVPKSTTTIWSATLNRQTEHANCMFCLSINPFLAKASDCNRLNLSQRRDYWNAIMEKVPEITISNFRYVPDQGISSDILMQTYYSAWYHIISNILPPSQETGYPYSCMATGKASLWAYGAPACPYAASWETFYGLILYSQIDAEAAFEMFTGIMSLVDKTGNLGGESLPSVKAQTAWILYSRTSDLDRLRTVFPALEAYLTWRLKNLRWIYLNRTPNIYYKDIDFVAAALIDIDYFIKICNALSQQEKAERWQSNYRQLYSSMKEWFFPADEIPFQMYDSHTHVRSAGNPLVTLKTLYLPVIEQQEQEKLLAYFHHIFDRSKPFGNFQSVKMENMAYLILGLLKSNQKSEALALAELTARDIAKTAFFAEEYSHDPTGWIYPGGVRPSLFGSALFITCMHILSNEPHDCETFSA